MAKQKSKDKVVAEKKTRVTLVGDVNVNDVIKSVQSSFPGVQVKVWSKRGKAQKKKTASSEVPATQQTQDSSPTTQD